MSRKLRKDLLFSFIVPYIIVALVIFVVQYMSNCVVMNAFKGNVIEIIKNSFKNDVDIIEQNLNKAKETASVVAQNTAARYDNIDRDNRNFYSRLSEARAELLSYHVSNNGIKDICIQNDAEDYLISFNTAYSNRIKYYKSAVFSKHKMPQDLLESSEKANGFSSENLCYYSDGQKTIPFVLPTPLFNSRTGSVMIYVEEKALLMPLSDLLNKSNGSLRVVDENGVNIFNQGETQFEIRLDEFKDDRSTMMINGKKYYLFREKGSVSKWDYVIFLPESYVLSDVRYYQALSLVFNFIILILGFAVCFFFTVRKSKSYMSLWDTIGISPEKYTLKSFVIKDEYKGLKQHISKIKDENASLLERESQNVLRRILNGEIKTSESIKKELKNHKIEFEGLCYGVMGIHFTADSLPGGLIRNIDSLLLGVICEVVPQARICFIENNEFAVLFSYNGDDYKQFAEESAYKLKKDIFAKYNITTVIGVGECVSELTELSQSYKQACEVVNYKFLIDVQDIYFYRQIPQDDDYFYPIEIENELFKSVRECNFESARKVLRKIQEENFIKRSLSVIAINELLSELRASIKKICRLQSEYLDFSYEECSVNHFFENAISFIYMICVDSNDANEIQSRGQKICLEIRNYIELHYNNPNLSLDVIAEEFRVHPNYLSNLFKKQTGINLISFLENTRIEKAAELLSSGKYTVNEVSVSVGFTNDSTFRRRFKKIKGVPPSAFFK